jgi:hypothetical protein
MRIVVAVLVGYVVMAAAIVAASFGILLGFGPQVQFKEGQEGRGDAT